MAEGTYEYECMRAELLGVDKPDYEEFLQKQRERAAAAEEEIVTEQLKLAEDQGEELKGTTGKLDELNHILAATQKKIDRFKFRCGSVTELIKTKIGNISGASEPTDVLDKRQENPSASSEVEERKVPVQPEEDTSKLPPKSDLTKALDNHVDSLDSLLDKAENAHSVMNYQNKQMRSFLK